MKAAASAGIWILLSPSRAPTAINLQVALANGLPDTGSLLETFTPPGISLPIKSGLTEFVRWVAVGTMRDPLNKAKLQQSNLKWPSRPALPALSTPLHPKEIYECTIQHMKGTAANALPLRNPSSNCGAYMRTITYEGWGGD